jgi:hypothetical protein
VTSIEPPFAIVTPAVARNAMMPVPVGHFDGIRRPAIETDE